jgi:hypothetical protein
MRNDTSDILDWHLPYEHLPYEMVIVAVVDDDSATR